MTKSKLATVILGALLLLGLGLRLYRLPELTTFEWDQARDVEVMSKILQGDFTLIGPVVRGEGSLFLGPLYYYLGAVILFFSSGNPLALSVFAVVLDLLVGYLLARLLLRQSFAHALFGLIVWIASSYLIKLSHVPWNVSLLQLWIIVMLYLWQRFPRGSLRIKYLFFFVAALSTHIHLSIVGFAAIFLISRYQEFFRLAPRAKLLSLFFLFLPLSPLALFDLRHNFLNTKLLISFFGSHTGNTELAEFIPVLITKLDYTLSEFLLSFRLPLIGIVVYLTALLVGVREKNSFTRLNLALLLAVPTMLVIYRDLDFAEYYLIPLFIPLLYLLARFFSKGVRDRFVLTLTTLAILFVSLQHFSATPQAFSLASKSRLADYLASFGSPLELRLEAPPGRRDGISYLLKQRGVELQNGASLIGVVNETQFSIALLDRTDKLGEEVFGGLRAAVFKVQ